MSSTADRELLITREVKAPAELVWEAWTNPAHIIHWWGPNGFTNTIHEMNVTPGGVWRYMMHGPDGTDFPNRITYKEVVKPKLLTYLHDSDKENDPAQFDVTVNFKAKGNSTEITMRMVFRDKATRDMVVTKYGAIEGGNQTLNKLEQYLLTM
ncbi:MAG: SRPBCC family protein [Cyclobacteriaceae bacterium]|nr:SRPBCC family protein [Cyclobacteriaceae bacterium]